MVVWSTAYNSVSPLKIYNKGCVRRFSLLLLLSSIKHNLVRATVVTGRLIFTPAAIYIWQQDSLLRALQPFMCICGTLESKHDKQNPQNKTGQGSIITKNMIKWVTNWLADAPLHRWLCGPNRKECLTYMTNLALIVASLVQPHLPYLDQMRHLYHVCPTNSLLKLVKASLWHLNHMWTVGHFWLRI